MQFVISETGHMLVAKLGPPCLGKSNYAEIEVFRRQMLVAQARGPTQFPSEETFGQRMDRLGVRHEEAADREQRFPRGKFAANAWRLSLGLAAYNVLRRCGQANQYPSFKEPVYGWRLPSVDQDLMYFAIRLARRPRPFRHCGAGQSVALCVGAFVSPLCRLSRRPTVTDSGSAFAKRKMSFLYVVQQSIVRNHFRVGDTFPEQE
jgi:hypothetical protein